MVVNFHSVYERYSPDVYRFALYMCGDSALAEDITHESFVRAWVTPGRIDVGTVKAYLFMIARNLYRAELKRRGRLAALSDNIYDLRPSPDSIADGRLELQEALDALQTLPETDRAALLMHALDGMAHAQIAAVLGVTEGAVKVRICRARLRLRQFKTSRKGKL
jgi:RNA polymerase sigma-70 factor (ECF subfamily)